MKKNDQTLGVDSCEEIINSSSDTIVNPISGRSIKKSGPTYKQLMKECEPILRENGKSDTMVNPTPRRSTDAMNSSKSQKSYIIFENLNQNPMRFKEEDVREGEGLSKVLNGKVRIVGVYASKIEAIVMRYYHAYKFSLFINDGKFDGHKFKTYHLDVFAILEHSNESFVERREMGNSPDEYVNFDSSVPLDYKINVDKDLAPRHWLYQEVKSIQYR